MQRRCGAHAVQCHLRSWRLHRRNDTHGPLVHTCQRGTAKGLILFIRTGTCVLISPHRIQLHPGPHLPATRWGCASSILATTMDESHTVDAKPSAPLNPACSMVSLALVGDGCELGGCEVVLLVSGLLAGRAMVWMYGRWNRSRSGLRYRVLLPVNVPYDGDETQSDCLCYVAAVG